MEKRILEISSLSVKYGEDTALDIRNKLCINQGDVVGVIGENGAGKSTLVNAILGEIKYQGEIVRNFEFEDVPSAVMLSGGLTSAVLLSFLREKELKSSLKAFFVIFNPRQVLKEQKCVEQLAKYYNVHLKILDISSLYDGMTVPSSLDFQKFNDYYMPFLNSVMISVVAAHVYYIGYKNIIFGTTSSASFHYPDCSLEFLKAQSKAIFYGCKIGVWIKLFN